MSQYLFFLGNTADLAWQELCAVSNRLQIGELDRLTDNTARLTTPKQLSTNGADDLHQILGGTIKIAEVIDQIDSHDPADVYQKFYEILSKAAPKRFAVAEIGRDHLPAVSVTDLKQELRSVGIKSSYLEISRHGISAAQWKQKVEEWLAWQNKDQVIFAKTLSLQDIDGWRQRDIDKPIRSRTKGMLQPKVARMMLNIALGNDDPTKAVILDPFVGTGTILIEAVQLGVPYVLGSDYSPEQVLAANKNLQWWQEKSGRDFQFEVVCRDIAHLNKSDFKQSPTHIVTEPFLGKLRPNLSKLEAIQKGLHKLYIGMIKTYQQLLNQDQLVVTILPTWLQNGQEFAMDKTLDEFKKYGFEEQLPRMRAGRAGSITQRYVHVLKYKPYVES